MIFKFWFIIFIVIYFEKNLFFFVIDVLYNLEFDCKVVIVM